jgi:PAS domain S-box-containing protein
MDSKKIDRSCFVISDATKPDYPITYATQTFLDMTGYAHDEVIGRNCRFLQGPKTNKKTVKKISESLKKGEIVDEILLNYTKNGCYFWVHLNIQPIHDEHGKLEKFIAYQTILSQKKAYDVKNESLSLGLTVYKTNDNYIKCAKCGKMVDTLHVYNHAKQCFKL